MNKQTFKLFFYYKNRKKIRDSFFLENFPPYVKTTILKHYSIENHKLIDFLVVLTKLFLFSLAYFIIYKATYITSDASQIVAFSLLTFVIFWATLSLFSLNKQSLPGVEHDHYFRMLGQHRNDLLKQVMYKRNKYAFLNWIFPITFFPFFYISILSGWEFIVFYLLMMVFGFFVVNIMLFLSQRLLFDYLKNIVIIDTLVVFFLMGIAVFISIMLYLIPIWLFPDIGIVWLEIGSGILYFLVSIFLLSKLNSWIMKNTINYSITSSIILSKKSRAKTNRLKDPGFFISLFYRKDNFRNALITKDLLTYYRKDKRELFVMIVMMLMAIMYSFFNGSTINAQEFDILDSVALDTILNFMIVIFFVLNVYKMNDTTWYSSEGKNLQMYKKLGYDKYQIYKAKSKVNYIINGIYITLYIFVPFLFIFNSNFEGIIYLVLRALILYLLYTNIIDYFLLEDTFNPRVKRYDIVAGMGRFNMILIIGMISFAISYISIAAQNGALFLENIPFLGYIILTTILTILLVIKTRNNFKEKKLIGMFEGGKIYG
jgi:hypothetical protein